MYSLYLYIGIAISAISSIIGNKNKFAKVDKKIITDDQIMTSEEQQKINEIKVPNDEEVSHSNKELDINNQISEVINKSN